VPKVTKEPADPYAAETSYLLPKTWIFIDFAAIFGYCAIGECMAPNVDV
jgi:hypothetical protein